MAREWTVTLNTGAKVPAFGLGTSLIDLSSTSSVVETAVKEGYRLFDCAHMYKNEAEIGEALQKCFKDGVVTRDKVFITSKLWVADFDNVTAACQTTLKNLQLDYLDLYLIHTPFELKKGAVFGKIKENDNMGYDPERMAKVWEAMEELVSKGLVKVIGISNFTITKTENLLKTAKIVPAVNQVECHPYFQQQKLSDYCDSKGIVLEAYYPLGSPGQYQSKSDVPIDNPEVVKIAEKHQATAAQVCISFALHRGMVVIPKTGNPARLKENLKSTELKLDEDDMRILKGLDRNLRLQKAAFYVRSSKGETVDDIWDVKEDNAFEIK